MRNNDVSKYYGEDYVSSGSFVPLQKTKETHTVEGLMGQAAVLAASANGVETSPIVRGIWVLENLLGTPPSPPPEGIEIPEPDIRGAKTVKEILAKHREIESCHDCHRSIDPIGFALENFDPIGQWRTHYPLAEQSDQELGLKVDATGVYQGKAFEGIVEMKQALMERLPLVELSINFELQHKLW